MSDKDDITIEDESGTDSFGRTKKEKDLRAKLQKAEGEAKEYLEGWQRAKADLVNFKREAEQGRERTVKLATDDLIERLTPVLDSFDMALQHIDDAGVSQIHKQLVDVLQSQGLQITKPEGETFDPNLHESVETVQVDDKNADNTIVAVIQTGYTLHDKILRAPKVKVGEFKK